MCYILAYHGIEYSLYKWLGVQVLVKFMNGPRQQAAVL